MTTSDEQEKLKQAEEWIRDEPIGSEHWKAAWDHIRYLLGMEPRFPVIHPAVREKAQALADHVLLRQVIEEDRRHYENRA